MHHDCKTTSSALCLSTIGNEMQEQYVLWYRWFLYNSCWFCWYKVYCLFNNVQTDFNLISCLQETHLQCRHHHYQVKRIKDKALTDISQNFLAVIYKRALFVKWRVIFILIYPEGLPPNPRCLVPLMPLCLEVGFWDCYTFDTGNTIFHCCNNLGVGISHH